MDYRAMFDAAYVGAWDLLGKDVTITISKVEAQVLTSQRGKNKKPIIFIEGKEKALVLNKTNAKTVAVMYGNDTTKWVGKQITIYPSTTSVGNETVDCIRIRPQVPTAKKGKE